MLSRMAENMYWFARYLERAENVARLVTVTTNLMLDLPRQVTADWGPLVDITGSREAFMKRHGEISEHRVVQFLLADRDNPGSLISSLTKARENLRTTRDIVPAEAWEQINRIHLMAQDKMGEALSRRGRHEFLQAIVGHCQQIVGLLGGDEPGRSLRVHAAGALPRACRHDHPHPRCALRRSARRDSQRSDGL